MVPAEGWADATRTALANTSVEVDTAASWEGRLLAWAGTPDPSGTQLARFIERGVRGGALGPNREPRSGKISGWPFSNLEKNNGQTEKTPWRRCPS